MGIQISPFGNSQFLTTGGVPAVGYQLFVYAGRSTEKIKVYTDQDGFGLHTNPIILDANGFTPYPIYLETTRSYKFVLAVGEDLDPPTVPLYIVDQVTVGTAEVGTALAEWTTGTTPTYVGPTQFSVDGDQRGLYHVGRRVQALLASGSIFGIITANTFSTVTTVTVQWDSGALDATISTIAYSFLSADGSAWPGGRSSGRDTIFLGAVSMPVLSAFNLIPAGIVVAFSGNTKPPAGWIICNGQAVSRTGFPNLYTALSTTFGAGDGVNTFNVPSITAINANILYCVRVA